MSKSSQRKKPLYRIGAIALQLAMIAAMAGALLGGLAVTLVCHFSALTPSKFWADGQCGATDKPAEVFFGSSVIGAVAGGIVFALLLLARQPASRNIQ